MTVRFQPINESAQSYPKPCLPVQPILDLSLIGPQTKQPTGSAFIDQGEFFVNARTALAQALISAGVDENSSVLIPAYHCGSMVEPALWLNAEVLLYQLTPDLTPQQPHLEQLISRAHKPVKALLLPHYFGFPQETEYWHNFCKKFQLILIEDCAHAFFGIHQNHLLGTTGEYAIASARKFFGCADGGILISKTANIGNPKLASSISAQIKSALKLLLQSAAAGGLGRFGKAIKQFDQWRTKPQAVAASQSDSSLKPQSWQWFDPAVMTRPGQPLSKWLIRHSHLPAIINTRRNNYRQLLEGIAHISRLKPLFPNLPDHVVPYMLPVLLTSGEAYFDRLKHAGVSIWRWEELADSDCPVSQGYRLQLLHIPCHQNLSGGDINTLITQLADILGKETT